MADLQYDYLTNNFTIYEPVEEPKKTYFENPFDKYDISDWATPYVSRSGIPLVLDLVTNKPRIINNNTEEIPVAAVETTPSTTNYDNIKPNKKARTLLAEQAMNYFMGKGLLRHLAAGLVGNLIRESGLDRRATNPHSKAFGIALWLGSRKKNLIAKYGNNPTFEQQLDFVWWELNNTHRKGLETLLNSKSAREAAANAMGWFEFSVGPQGAINDMKKHGLNGDRSMKLGIENAEGLL